MFQECYPNKKQKKTIVLCGILVRIDYHFRKSRHLGIPLWYLSCQQKSHVSVCVCKLSQAWQPYQELCTGNYLVIPSGRVLHQHAYIAIHNIFIIVSFCLFFVYG